MPNRLDRLRIAIRRLQDVQNKLGFSNTRCQVISQLREEIRKIEKEYLYETYPDDATPSSKFITE